MTKRAAARAGRPAAEPPAQRSFAAARASDNPFRQPEELAYGDFHLLRVQKTRTVLLGVAGAEGQPQEVEFLSYNGRLVGPTIRVRRGTRVRVRVRNDLTTPDGPPPPGDIPHGLCTTNLHTHGLHVSPADPADNVFREIPPRGHHTFTYDIPRDHPSGTFWYHAHKHGSVAYQLTNGMAGALIVDGDADDNIHDLDDLPEVAAARDRVFVLQQLLYRVDPADKVGRVDARDIFDDRAVRGCDIPDVGTAAVSQKAVNGVVMPTYEIAPGEVQRWRIVHAGREDNFNLAFSDSADQPTTAIGCWEIAVDGLATGAMTPRSTLFLAPGYRTDVLVRAPSEPGVYYLKDGELPAARSLRKAAKPVNYLAKIVVRGVPRSMGLPAAAAVAKCRPHAAVKDHELANPRKPRVIEFDSDDASGTFTVNGQPFSAGPPIAVRLNSAEEWVIRAKRNPHLFHIHVNPFEVILERGPDGRVTRSEWRDTLFVDEGAEYTIRTRFRDFTGETVLHCHILDHEDQGMMRKVVIGDRADPIALSPAADPAPPLRLPDDRGGERPLLAGGLPTVVIFVRGPSCGHCMKELAAVAKSVGRTPAVVVAVSAEEVDSSAAIRAALGIPAGDGFRLHADPDGRAFRAFGCYTDGPLHGLFVVDSGGVIRARYVGATPFSDPEAVVASVNAICPSARK